MVAGQLVVPYEVGAPSAFLWGGSEKAAYNAGTVSVTAGSRTATGAGTLWAANADSGMYLVLPSQPYILPVASVDSNTQLTLDRPWPGTTVAGVAYALTVYQLIDTTISRDGAISKVASVAGRLVVVDATEPTVVRFSAINDFTFAVDDYHRLPAPWIALSAIRDTLLVFTNAGVYQISNMAFDLTDAAGNPQQRLELVNPDLIAWGHEGIAGWKGAVVVPALDSVWLMDGVSAPVRISDRIADLYLGYVRTSGYKPGVAEVFNGHYLLPILDGSNGWVDTLVCRMQPTHNGGDFAWTQLSGFGAKVAAFAERPSSPPVLLGASTQSSSRVLNCTSYFSPAAAVKADADGTTHAFQLVTRNIPTGGNVKNRVDYLKVKYLLTADTGDAPTMTMEANPDGAGWTTLALGGGTPTAGVNDGYQEIYWNVRMAARFIRFRLTLASDDAVQVKPGSIQIFIFKSGKY